MSGEYGWELTTASEVFGGNQFYSWLVGTFAEKHSVYSSGLPSNKNVVTDYQGKLITEDKPTIPTKTSQLTNDGTGTSGVTYVLSNDSRLSDSRTPTSHTHDDRYYTESEVDTLLGAISSALNNYVPTGWTNLYNSTFGEVKHNGSMVSCYITTGSKSISATDWTEMARMGTNGLGISSTYFPPHNIFYQYTDGIVLKLDTNGILSANRPSGSKK